jgi:serine protease inhibitor
MLLPFLATLASTAQDAAVAQNAFGMRLLAAECERQPKANVFVSPTSVFLALAMAESGSEGKTRTAMRTAMHIAPESNAKTFHEAASGMLKALRSQRDVEVAIANSLWSSPAMPLSPAFVAEAGRVFDAQAFQLDFKSPGAADTVNRWVKQATRDKIPSIVTPDVMRSSVALLANAVYFKGAWRYKFAKSATQDADFFLATRQPTKAIVPMMHRSGLKSAYRKGPGFEAAALQYGLSGYTLFAILPDAKVSPEQALAKVDARQLLDRAEPYELDLKLPRFTLDFSGSLAHSLKDMGMGIAFQYPGAEFGPMGSKVFYIGDVIHKTRLEVDEEGTVAAAATAIPMAAGSAMPAPMEKKTLVFNRPFAVLLCERSTGAILFAGVVYDPLRK